MASMAKGAGGREVSDCPATIVEWPVTNVHATWRHDSRRDQKRTEIQSNSRCDDLLDGVSSLSLGSPELLGRQLRHSHCDRRGLACWAFTREGNRCTHTSSEHLECVLLLLQVAVERAGVGCFGLDPAQGAAGVDAEAMTHVMDGFCWMADKLLGESFDKAGEKRR